MSEFKYQHNVSNEEWARAERYHNSFLIPQDKILDAVRANCVKNDLPDIAVSDAEGKHLNLLAQAIGAKRILEVGTLGGYSAILMARALPDDGELVSFEVDDKHVKVSRENIETAGLSAKIKVVHGPAVETISQLGPDASFDMAFIDADKENNSTYFTQAKRLVRKGGVIIVDNVNRYGRISDPSFTDEATEGVRDLLKLIQQDPEIEATTISTVGVRGFDGFTWALRK